MKNAFIQQKWRCRTIMETNTFNTLTLLVTSLRIHISQNELLVHDGAVCTHLNWTVWTVNKNHSEFLFMLGLL